MALFTSSISFGVPADDGTPTPKENVWADFAIGEELGRGTFGCVYLARARHPQRGSDAQVAVKEIPKRRVQGLDQLRKEVAIMRRLHHANVLNLIEHYENRTCVYLVLELCTGGEVFALLTDGMSELDAAVIMHQTLLAVHHCHERNVVHRDLKPQNLLLKTKVRSVADGAQVKVVDFGASRIYDPTTSRGAKLREVMGTVSYMAPEVILARSQGYTNKCDLWSLGVILYQMICGKKPFANKRDIQTGNWKFTGEEWARVSINCKRMVKRMLEVDPFKRMDATEALRHPWIVESRIVAADEERSNTARSPSPQRMMGASLVEYPRRSPVPTAAPTRRLPSIHSPDATAALQMFVIESKVSRRLAGSVANASKDSGLTPQEQFAALDTNKDGTISLNELLAHVQGANGIQQDVAGIMSSFDVNGDFRIEWDEFIAKVHGAHAQVVERRSQPPPAPPSEDVGIVGEDEHELLRRVQCVIDEYYVAERAHRLGPCRGHLLQTAREVMTLAGSSRSRKVHHALADLKSLLLI
jgi:serine/threonine protein kinase